MPPRLRVRPYTDFITPALHRRFNSAAVILLTLCYLESILIAGWKGFFWTWFPFSYLGIRTGLLFISVFVLFILRVSYLHVGFRTTPSPVQTFQQYAFRMQTVWATLFYGLSAWLFSEIYIWSSHTGLLTDSKYNERPRLNERRIYLTVFFLSLAALQTGLHIYHDFDRLLMPLTKTNPTSSTDPRAHLVCNPLDALKRKIPWMLRDSAQRAFAMMFIMPFIYSILLRQHAWNISVVVARIMFYNLPKSNILPSIGPFHLSILLRTWWGGFMLFLLWEVANVSFTLYVSQEPLKNERPITYESRDPNGSLLLGLKGKKLVTRANALWELLYIAQCFAGRRKLIFDDIDRQGGSTWSQIMTICIEDIDGISARINAFLNPITPPAKAPEALPRSTLPRLASDLKNENVYAPSPKSKGILESASNRSGILAKELLTNGTPSQTKSPSISDRGRQFASLVLTREQNTTSDRSAPWAMFEFRFNQFLLSPFCWPFRQTYRRRMATLLLGTPYGEPGLFVDAIKSLARFAIASLTEDAFGNVQHDVPTIIRTFTTTIENMKKIKKNLPRHWTDAVDLRESAEWDQIMGALQVELTEVLAAFGEYATDLKLSRDDMAKAKAAATSLFSAPAAKVEMKEKNR